ncbi:uncharacterized protein I206_103454 [Kwoniella pini CBS 10737]|uniref:Uncharacterized protein n=1 Tax=Kwoniella pini CBS 10737 TaxID=1296096 RepID=A0A1B9I9X9_9TREE|nr:uncharacterized protein I206_01543 [Kwoniella pini CBS 10737]OCF52257.1 hypothetical protein I206_01543 [Kwoniella pini CBS 10737]
MEIDEESVIPVSASLVPPPESVGQLPSSLLTTQRVSNTDESLIDIEDDLASNLVSLAVDWRPIAPNISFISNDHTQAPQSIKSEISLEHFHPYIDFFQSTSSMQVSSTCASPAPTSSYYLDDKFVDPSNYILPITQKPEDRSKYLDPRIPTDIFWNFVGERQVAWAKERREKKKRLTDIYSSYDGRSSCLQSNSNESENEDCVDPVFKVPATIVRDEKAFIYPSPKEKSLYADRISYEGIELIDRKSDKTSSPTSKGRRTTRKHTKGVVDRKIINKLIRSTKAYNKEKQRIDNARKHQSKKINDLALFCAKISNDKKLKDVVSLSHRLKRLKVTPERTRYADY